MHTLHSHYADDFHTLPPSQQQQDMVCLRSSYTSK